jgi:HSP20 family protein
MTSLRKYERWDPFRELDEIRGRFDRLLGIGGGREELATGDWSPACNVSETDNEYRVQAELPDVKKEDVRVTLEQGALCIAGERREEREQKGEKYHRREVSYGSFMRRFGLPEDADPDRVEATFKDGMLRVVVPKVSQGKGKQRQIEVH